MAFLDQSLCKIGWLGKISNRSKSAHWVMRHVALLFLYDHSSSTNGPCQRIILDDQTISVTMLGYIEKLRQQHDLPNQHGIADRAADLSPQPTPRTVYDGDMHGSPCDYDGANVRTARVAADRSKTCQLSQIVHGIWLDQLSTSQAIQIDHSTLSIDCCCGFGHGSGGAAASPNNAKG